MLTSTLSAIALLAANVAAKIYYAGVSESGGEFGVYGVKGQGLPGTYGVDYMFIDESTIDTYVDVNKINLFRVAFLLERMCPLATGLGKTFNETHFTLYETAINYITVTKGAYAILDPHNYMRYNDPSSQPTSGSIIGDTSDPAAATTQDFQDFWMELAGRFKTNEKVIFGIMNEPHDMDTGLLLLNDQAAVNGIRAAGAKQLIIAPGNGYTGGHSFLQTPGGDAPSGDYLYKLTDPVNNTAIDIHEYLDEDFSGSHIACTQDPIMNLTPLTGWLKQHSLKAMITEFGGSNTTMCATYLKEIIGYMANNTEYIGWAAWAAGPFWGTYSPCCSDGGQYGSLEPGSTAADGSPSFYTTVFLDVIKPLLPKKLQKSGVSSIHGGKTS